MVPNEPLRKTDDRPAALFPFNVAGSIGTVVGIASIDGKARLSNCK